MKIYANAGNCDCVFIHKQPAQKTTEEKCFAYISFILQMKNHFYFNFN